MNLSVQIEKPSKIVRKLTIKVPAKTVAQRFERGLAEVARTARLKGFRPGHAPMSVVKQFYGEDVRHRLYHSLIDESFAEAVKQEKIMTVGRPAIESPDHTHGHGEHDHAVSEDKDFTFTATAVRVPTYLAHCESVQVECETPFELAEVRSALEAAAGVQVVDQPLGTRYPMAITGANQDPVFVGRLRRDLSVENGLNLWVVSDNLRKGAALNAVQIGEILVQR